MKLDPEKQLKGLKVTFVSLVNHGANRRDFIVAKSQDDNFDFQKEIKIIAKNEDQKVVYGTVYAPNEPDTDGEWATEEDIEKAAFGFMEEFTNIDVRHNFVPGAGSPIESWVFKKDDEVFGVPVVKGEWLLGVRIKDDSVWNDVKEKKLNSFSLAGVVQKNKKQDDKNLLQKILDVVTNKDKESQMDKETIQKMIDDKFTEMNDKIENLSAEVSTLKELKQKEQKIDDAEIIKSHSGAIKELQEAFDVLSDALIVTKSNPETDDDEDDGEEKKKKTKSDRPIGKWQFK